MGPVWENGVSDQVPDSRLMDDVGTRERGVVYEGQREFKGYRPYPRPGETRGRGPCLLTHPPKSDLGPGVSWRGSLEVSDWVVRRSYGPDTVHGTTDVVPSLEGN